MNCPRCNRPLMRSWDTLCCLVHGTVDEPRRAWDAVSLKGVGERRPNQLPVSPPWSREMKREWNQYDAQRRLL